MDYEKKASQKKAVLKGKMRDSRDMYSKMEGMGGLKWRRMTEGRKISDSEKVIGRTGGKDRSARSAKYRAKMAAVAKKRGKN
jgi:hypothetical protein